MGEETGAAVLEALFAEHGPSLLANVDENGVRFVNIDDLKLGEIVIINNNNNNNIIIIICQLASGLESCLPDLIIRGFRKRVDRDQENMGTVPKIVSNLLVEQIGDRVGQRRQFPVLKGRLVALGDRFRVDVGDLLRRENGLVEHGRDLEWVFLLFFLLFLEEAFANLLGDCGLLEKIAVFLFGIDFENLLGNSIQVGRRR